MNTPCDSLSSAVNRASEIIWWNRSLTKLNQFDEIENAVSFIEEELIDKRGPYIEYVRTPKGYDQSANDFLASQGYTDTLRKALVDVLLDGDLELPLYQHQAEMIHAIESNDNDNILAVPTATGKTESFFFPILHECLQSDRKGLKAIVIYPMKTLEIDQFNRFVKYLDAINRDLPTEDQLTIGIWDRDTPNSVGNYRSNDIERGAPIRGLECPRTGEKLRVYGDYELRTETETYDWIRVTRNGIRAKNPENTVDILITNPEALDYMFVNDKEDTRNILGRRPGDQPVKHIVYDEAHVWSGVKGAAIALLSQRLKHFYSDNNPQITMVSATVENPEELAQSLAGVDNDPVNYVGFTPEPLTVTGTPDFSRIAPCTLPEVIQAIYYVKTSDLTQAEFNGQNPHLSAALETLCAIGIIERATPLKLSASAQPWVSVPIERTVRELAARKDEYETLESVIADPDGLQLVQEAFLDSQTVISHWEQFIHEHVPEVSQLAAWFTDNGGTVGFRHYDDLLEQLGDELEDPRGVLNTLLLFGRIGGVLTDKYHVFLKPPSKAFYCEHCRAVRRTESCIQCRAILPELRCCTTCHYPHLAVAISDEEVQFEPLGGGSTDRCPGCQTKQKLQDINVPTSTLLTFMLTELCRQTPSRKSLVFSDSRSTAEGVWTDIMDTEYQLMAESLYVKNLMENGGTQRSKQLFYDVRTQLKQEYWDPLKSNLSEVDAEAEEMLNPLLTRIRSKAQLSKCRHLLQGALIIPEIYWDIDDPRVLLMGYELFAQYARRPSLTFTQDKIEIQGQTPGRLRTRLLKLHGVDEQVVDAHLGDLLQRLVDVGFLTQRPWGTVQQEIQDADAENEDIEAAIEHLEIQRTELATLGGIQTVDSAIFERDLFNDESSLRLVPRVTYCRNCYYAAPAPKADGLAQCPKCASGVETYDRFEITEDGYQGLGYASIECGWPYALDHWAHDISAPLTGNQALEFITVGVHKGDIPPSLRGSIEEGFRKSNPDINIVSATPTMELGIDIGSLDAVTQVGMPPTLTNYVQRSGRTGRSQGSSSLVSTVVRGEHPIDNHYYGNLSSFFSNFTPVRVPNPMQFDELLASHIMTESVSYLARNQGTEEIFSQIYQIKDTSNDATAYSNAVYRFLTVLRRYVVEKRPDVREHIIDVFGPNATTVFDDVFGTQSRLSLDVRFHRTFDRLTELGASASAIESVANNYKRLDQWLHLLGYLANYRSFGGDIPIRIRGRDEKVAFESSGRLFEIFPGPENKPGAVVPIYGEKYIVNDVKAADRIKTVTICENQECERAYESYNSSKEICPHCTDSLQRVQVYGVGSVSLRETDQFERRYRTYPIVSTSIEDVGRDSDRDQHELILFGIPSTITASEFESLSFIHSYERRHPRRSEVELLKSEAKISEAHENVDDFLSDDLDDLLGDATENDYAPIGQRMHTNGIEIALDVSHLRKRFASYESTREEATWSQLLISLQQAITKAVAVVAECELSDFTTKVMSDDDNVRIYIIDGREGGNGISWQVLRALIDSTELEQRVREVANCTECGAYCDQCLLLSRTSPHYLTNNLLNRHALDAAVRSVD